MEEVVFNWDLFPSNMVKYLTSVVKLKSVFDKCVHPYSFRVLHKSSRFKACTGTTKVQWREEAVANKT